MSKQAKYDDRMRALRNALGQFTTGVAIVTAPGEDARPVGMTINSFGSVSLAPALVSWCIDRHAASYDSFVNADSFSITVLAVQHVELAMRFATRGAEKFRDIDTGGEAAPVIAGGCAWFKCERYRSIALGDHTLIVGKVREFAQNRTAPLVFSGGCFRELNMETIDSSRQAYRAA